MTVDTIEHARRIELRIYAEGGADVVAVFRDREVVLVHRPGPPESEGAKLPEAPDGA